RRRGDGVLGERDRGRRSFPRSVLLPQEAALLGAHRRRRAVGGAALRLPLAREGGGAGAARRRRAPRAGAGAADRPGHQRHAALALPLIVLAVWMAPYRMRRITAFVDPWGDPRGSGFQIIQSWLALGNGGLVGQGIGGSRQKLFYLPESHTDFIFAIVGEELGFVGAVAIVALFAVLIWRGLRIVLRAPDAFGAYLALGFTVLLATQ